jgi:hypothetical protein
MGTLSKDQKESQVVDNDCLYLKHLNSFNNIPTAAFGLFGGQIGGCSLLNSIFRIRMGEVIKNLRLLGLELLHDIVVWPE